MSATRRLLIAVGALATVTAIGVLGFVHVEGYAWVDALYMTVITLSTVGYREVHPLSDAGKLFVVGLIATGVGTVLYLLSVVAETLFEGRLRELYLRTAMQRRIDHLNGHVIVCGFGRFGRVVADELTDAGVLIVVIELSRDVEADLARADIPYEIGSATSEEVLEKAGIDRASAIVVATSSDSDNVFITLAARERRPDLHIHARGETPEVRRRLRQAGANQVVSAYQLGGSRMAASILRPSVVDFLELASPRRGEPVDLEEIEVSADCELVDVELSAIEREQLRVVAVKRGEEPVHVLPDRGVRIAAGDHLVVIGRRSDLSDLAARAAGPPLASSPGSP